MTDPITVRWTWALPPFHAYYVTRQGSKRGVARWTPGAARWRAHELWCEYLDKLLDIAWEDRRAGRHEYAKEITDWIFSVLPAEEAP